MKLKMNYYISDLHFGHENVIHFDKRPFADVKEMDTVMIAHWNKCVKLDDHVFIVGDFF
jgi:calcineurin-like phosphoesterase family protein